MSAVNLMGSIASPGYDYLSVVHSSVLDEAVGRGAVIDGVVGSLVEERPEPAIAGVNQTAFSVVSLVEIWSG